MVELAPQSSGVETGQAWLRLADLLLQHAALAQRASRDVGPDPLAGLRISDDSVDSLLAELPGVNRASAAALPGPVDAEIAAQIAGAFTDFIEAATGGGPFAEIVASSSLTMAEAVVLALLVAVELDPRRQRLVGYLNDDVTQRRLTTHTLRQLAVPADNPNELLLAVGPGGGLRRAALLQVDADAPWGSAAIRVHSEVVWWLFGDRTISDGIPAGARLVAVPGRGSADLAVAAGEDRIRRTQAVIAAVEANGFLMTPVPPTAAGWDPIVRRASLAGLCVLVETERDLPEYATDRIDRTPHLAWAICSPAPLSLTSLPRRGWTHLEVSAEPATPDELAAVLDGEQPLTARLTADQLDAVAGAANAMDGDVRAAVRRLAAGGSRDFTERVVPKRGWDDLILNEHDSARLKEVVIRAKHATQVFGEWGFDAPSSGVLALFAGPSGTGKTLAAEVIAHELELDLFRVDLSQVVDKYIGETEKRLGALFKAAEASPMVLFLDEADAILGKRTEVSDAHDRYANIEVAYLLQRLERHNGVAIFASNLATNIDAAFTRRIHVSVAFQLPGAAERRRIWERCIPTAVRAAEIDWELLATALEISGGQIRNIAVRAAFLAAEANSALTMAVLVESAERELTKSGRLFPLERFNRAASR